MSSPQTEHRRSRANAWDPFFQHTKSVGKELMEGRIIRFPGLYILAMLFENGGRNEHSAALGKPLEFGPVQLLVPVPLCVILEPGICYSLQDQQTWKERTSKSDSFTPHIQPVATPCCFPLYSTAKMQPFRSATFVKSPVPGPHNSFPAF